MISYNNSKPLPIKKIIEHEKKIYTKQLIGQRDIPESVVLHNIRSRAESDFKDKVFNMPQNIFLIYSKKYPTIVGRKIISQLCVNGKIIALNCSQISSSMLLGLLEEDEFKEKLELSEIISIKYKPFTNGEKISIFKHLSINKMVDIYYPYQYKAFETNQQKTCSTKGWDISPARITNLSNGERHFRKFTYKYFKNLVNSGDVIFDPACSTGEFLYSFKAFFPECKTIGQDLSPKMTEYAKNFVDEIYTGDSLSSPVRNNSIDVMFLRFLNSEIVTKENSYDLFDSLEKKVKKGGIIVLFGHTPVLLERKYFLQSRRFELLNTIGNDKKYNIIFQYYVLRKLVH